MSTISSETALISRLETLISKYFRLISHIMGLFVFIPFVLRKTAEVLTL